MPQKNINATVKKRKNVLRPLKYRKELSSGKIVNVTGYGTSVFVSKQGLFKPPLRVIYEENNKHKGYNTLEAMNQQAVSVYPLLL